MRMAQRNGYRKSAALALDAFDLHCAAMKLREFLHHCEANAGSLVSTSSDAFNPVKALEYPRQFLLRYANPGVAHRKLGQAGSRPHRNGYLPLHCELERIGDE